MCSAVVVARDVVLTAGHCAAGADEHRVHWRGDDGAPVLIAPAAKAVHPGYDADAVEARRRSIDLALIRLPEPLPARFEAAALSATAAPRIEPHVRRLWRGARGRRALERHVPHRGARRGRAPWAKRDPGVGQGRGRRGRVPRRLRRAGRAGRVSAVFAVAAWAAGVTGAGCGGLSQGVLLGPQRDWIDRTLKVWGRSAAWR